MITARKCFVLLKTILNEKRASCNKFVNVLQHICDQQADTRIRLHGLPEHHHHHQHNLYLNTGKKPSVHKNYYYIQVYKLKYIQLINVEEEERPKRRVLFYLVAVWESVRLEYRDSRLLLNAVKDGDDLRDTGKLFQRIAPL